MSETPINGANGGDESPQTTDAEPRLNDYVIELFGRIDKGSVEPAKKKVTADGRGVYDTWLNDPLARKHPRDNNAGSEYFGRFGFSRVERSYLQKAFVAGPETIEFRATMTAAKFKQHYTWAIEKKGYS